MSDQDSQRPQSPDPAIPGERDRTAPYAPGSEPTAHNEAARAERGARLHPGETVAGRFVIVRFIARGGMGEVYEANDTALRTRVALKTLRPEFAADANSLERFRREVLLARSVAHPNVCRVFELHSTPLEDGPLHFLTMEFLEGESLASLLERRGRLSTLEALPLFRQIAAALDAAHAHGVVHRDLKPSNVLLVERDGPVGSEGLRVVVTDFGIARALSTSRKEFETTGGTGTNEFLGTPDYIAPEQVSGRGPISPATDVFSFGVVIYQVVTGALPFPGDTPFEVVARRLQGPPRPPLALQRSLEPGWNRAILHCLEPDPARRPQTATAVLEEIEARGRGASAVRRRTIALVTAALLGALLAVGLFVKVRSSPPGRPVLARPVIAVLPLALEVPPSDAWIGPAVSHLLAGEVEAAASARAVPWWRVASAYRSLALDPDQVLRPEQRQRLVELLPAELFLEGSIRCPVDGVPDQCRIRLQLRKADGSERIQPERIFRASQPMEALGALGSEIREALASGARSPLPAADRSRVERPPAVLKALGEALSAYGHLDLSAARRSLEQAASLDPRDFDVWMAQSHVLQRLGLFVRARKAAEQAAASAASPEQARKARALVDWLGPDPDRAVAAYRRLFEERSDDVELALQLSRRLPAREGLVLLKRVRQLPEPVSSDLLLDVQEAELAAAENDVERSRSLWAGVQARAMRLKARGELSLALARRDIARAEVLAIESGDGQRAAYLHLMRAGSNSGDPQQRVIEDAITAFRGLQDRIGVHAALARKALASGSWGSARRTLAESLEMLAGTDEAPSSAYQQAAAVVAFHLGELKAARRALELARETARGPSLSSVFVDHPDFQLPVDLDALEREILEQEDRLDEADGLAKGTLRRTRSVGDTSAEEFLCWSQCQRGRWSEGARCFEGLLAGRATFDFEGRGVAECYWGAGEVERAARAANLTKDRRIMGATDIVTFGGEGGDNSLPTLASGFRKAEDILELLRTELVLGTAELRFSRLAPSRGFASSARRAASSGRRRVQVVLEEAQRRELPLLARQARAVLLTETAPAEPARP